jgi:hypothetical protein
MRQPQTDPERVADYGDSGEGGYTARVHPPPILHKLAHIFLPEPGFGLQSLAAHAGGCSRPPPPHPQHRQEFPSLPYQFRALPLRRASHQHQALRSKVSPMNRQQRRHGRLPPLPRTIHNPPPHGPAQQLFLPLVRLKPQPPPKLHYTLRRVLARVGTQAASLRRRAACRPLAIRIDRQPHGCPDLTTLFPRFVSVLVEP